MHKHTLVKHTSWSWWCFGLLDQVYECTKCKKLYDLEDAELTEEQN